VKKVFSFLVMSLIALLPFNVDAATKISPNCGDKDADGNVTCTIGYNITDDIVDTLTVTLTEEAGAEVISVDNASSSDWTVSSPSESGNVWTVILASPGVSGEGDLFTFKYTPSGQTDCKVRVALGEQVVEVIPDDTTTENKDTGATLPFIALSFVAVIAVGAYLATKNKAKMYKI